MKQRSHPDEFPLAIGQQVRTSDGELLGDVVEVLKSHFQVETPGRDNYWLSKDTLSPTEDNWVQVSFAQHQLEEFSMKQPVADAATPTLDAEQDAFPDAESVEEGLRRQREGYDAGPHALRR